MLFFKYSTLLEESRSGRKFSSIPLDCDSDGLNVNINVGAEHAAIAGSGVLALSEVEGAATGVGIQLLNGGDLQPLMLGQDVRLLSSVKGVNSMKLAARYYQTAETVGAGKVVAVATYVVRYK